MPHPYHPTTLSIPNYVPPRPTIEILSQFFVWVVGILVASWWVISRKKGHTFSKKLMFVWFVACGCIHCVLEGYFVVNHREVAGQSTLLADCWKEYSYSDSRYMSGDPFILAIESITTLTWGPLSLLSAYFIYHKHPAEYIFAFLVSTGHLYGAVLYYFSALAEGAPHCSPDPISFWLYFVGFNAPWIFAPIAIMWSSAKETIRCIGIVQQIAKKKK